MTRGDEREGEGRREGPREGRKYGASGDGVLRGRRERFVEGTAERGRRLYKGGKWAH